MLVIESWGLLIVEVALLCGHEARDGIVHVVVRWELDGTIYTVQYVWYVRCLSAPVDENVLKTEAMVGPFLP